MSQIVRGLSLKCDEPTKVWTLLHADSAYGDDYFLQIIEEKYAGRFASNYDTLYNHVEAIKQEADFQITKLTAIASSEI